MFLFGFSIILICSSFANSYKILAIFPVPIRSHYLFIDPLMVELARRGHNVTIYDTFPKTRNIENYHETDISHCFRLPYLFVGIERMRTSKHKFDAIRAFYNFLPRFEEIANCQTLLQVWNTTEQYDLLITEVFNNDVFLLFGEKLKIPIVAFYPSPPMPWHSEMMGLINNPSYLPTQFSGYVPKMKFIQRLHNFLMHIYGVFVYKFQLQKTCDDMVSKIFGSSTTKMEDIAKRVDILIANIHFSYHGPRPLVPNVIEAGGLHISEKKPLPKGIEKFINESKHGVIYFSMGTLLKSESFPLDKREAFLYAFSKIPQRVLWKWEDVQLPGKPDNVMVSKWMPQRDILAHPNVKLFISHGGLMGTSEAIYEGVPILGIPIFSDQFTNIKSIEANGAAELVDYQDISKEMILQKIQNLLNDSKYSGNAKKLSQRYRDRPMTALENAVYWTEYVARHKGASHLRTAAADMPLYQYLLIDVIAFLLSILVIVLAIAYFVIKCISKLVCTKLGLGLEIIPQKLPKKVE